MIKKLELKNAKQVTDFSKDIINNLDFYNSLEKEDFVKQFNDFKNKDIYIFKENETVSGLVFGGGMVLLKPVFTGLDGYLSNQNTVGRVWLKNFYLRSKILPKVINIIKYCVR
jgi:hypothetical protein